MFHSFHLYLHEMAKEKGINSSRGLRNQQKDHEQKCFKMHGAQPDSTAVGNKRVHNYRQTLRHPSLSG